MARGATARSLDMFAAVGMELEDAVPAPVARGHIVEKVRQVVQ